ncbi:MAG: hypothetical protein C4K60_09775 [Ideonella sp. MAG2]|nr:MAG: hypothetical protein C4K60_09775 [Ideonella sp. MAG2]
MIAAAALSLALVTQDAAPLRAAANDNAPTQAQLWPGDALEVRGERLGWLQVWDHRRERPGYIRATHVRPISTEAARAPELLSVLRFVRDTPGAESLGIAYAAAYLKAVPATQLNPEALDALGHMAERLAQRASSRHAVALAQAGITAAPTGGVDSRLSGHLDGVRAYGVSFQSFEQDGSVRLCYDGEAFQRLLAHPQATPEQKGRALLGLTRHDCVAPTLTLSEREAHTQRRAALLDSLDASEWAALPEQMRNQLRLRRAGVWAELAHSQARRGQAAQAAGQRALQELAAILKTELSDDDQAAYKEAAIRVGASRWAAEAAMPAAALSARPSLMTQAGEPGQTCVLLVDAQHGPQAPLLKRCTWGVPWLASAKVNVRGDAVALAVQPLPAWRELWLMKKTESGWAVEVMPPASGNVLGSDLGYVEFAGWVPETEPKLLLARESRSEGRFTRRFEVAQQDTLTVDKQASTPELLTGFKRWAEPAWRKQTVALR